MKRCGDEDKTIIPSSNPHPQLWRSRTPKLCLCCMQVARKLVILEGDLERSEERAEVAEA